MLYRRLLPLLAIPALTGALAAGPTGEQELVGEFAAHVAPLALSADGRMRLHVDANQVLHRVALSDPAQERRFTLPFPIRAIAASRTGQKVAVRTDPGCVGLVDFGTATDTPTLRWLVGSFPERRTETATNPEPWSDQPAPDCAPPAEQSSFALRWPTLALSVDGRLLATEYQVVDTETHRLVASLRGQPTRLRFVDGGRRLLAQMIVGSEGYESVPDRWSESNLAVWDLADGALAGVRRQRMGGLGASALLMDVPTDAAVAWWVDEAPWAPPPAPQVEAVRVLHRWDALRCGLPADFHLALAPQKNGLRQLVVDPQGRWVATVRNTGDDKDGWEELVVQALADGRVLLRRRLASPIDGLLATPDGARLLGLAAHGQPDGRADQVMHPADALVEIAVDVANLKAVPPPAGTTGCGAEGVPIEARRFPRPVRQLRGAWRQVFAAPPVAHDAPAPARPEDAPPSCTLPDQFDTDGRGAVFLRRDGTLWVDRFTTIAQLDPLTGKTLRSLPTPRGPKVCSALAPTRDGFFNVQGDTLTWRPLEAGAAPRRVIEQRPGWTATDVLTGERSVLVRWRARPGTLKPPSQPDNIAEPNLVVAIYDATGRPVNQQAENAESVDYAGDGAMPIYAPAFMLPCVDAAGPIVDAVAWQVDVFDTLRARDCGAKGAPGRTLLWTDTDIAPRPGSARDRVPARTPWARDGTIAVGQDDRRLRIFDLEQRRELGQMLLGDDEPRSVVVSAALGLVVVESVAAGADGPSAVVTAWRFR